MHRFVHHAFVLIMLTSGEVNAAGEPTLPTPGDLHKRRNAIYAELDKNVEAVKQCFVALDSIPEDEDETRQLIDRQIQQLDDRSTVLHDELEQIEKFEKLTKRQRELSEQVIRLRDEAQQLQKHGHHAPAQLRLAKANSIQRTLEDGTWKILASDHLRGEAKDSEFVSVLQLKLELESLKGKTEKLQKELATLRATVKQLENRLGQNDRE